MSKYRLTAGVYSRRIRGGRVQTLHAGDVFRPTPSELDKMRDQLEKVRESGTRKRPAPKRTIPPKVEKPLGLHVVDELGGGWFMLSDGRKVHGKRNLNGILGKEE